MPRVLLTRTTPEGFRRRRYEEATGRRYTTIEIPIEMWHRLTEPSRSDRRRSAVMRELDRQSLQRQAASLLAAGRTKTEIAQALGVHRMTILRWTKEIQ